MAQTHSAVSVVEAEVYITMRTSAGTAMYMYWSRGKWEVAGRGDGRRASTVTHRAPMRRERLWLVD
jgi:hypothetical protein